MSTSKKNYSSTCFSSLLQKFICTGNSSIRPVSPNHISQKPNQNLVPSLKDINQIKIGVQIQTEDKDQENRAMPGIVARLMGLDSLPRDTHWVPKVGPDESTLRSKSLNSLNFFLDLDAKQTWHHRERTSISFDELPIPTLSQGPTRVLSNHCTRNVGRKWEDPSGKKRENQMGHPRKMKKDSKKEKEVFLDENEHGNLQKKRRNPRTMKNNGNERFPTKRKNQKGKMKNEKVGASDTPAMLSPNSVLEHHHIFSSKSDAPSNKAPKTSSSRRKSQRKTQPKSNSNGCKNEDKRANVMYNNDKSKETREMEKHDVELLIEICRLAECHVTNTEWIQEKDLSKFDNEMEGLCVDFGHEILHILLNEFIDELLFFR